MLQEYVNFTFIKKIVHEYLGTNYYQPKNQIGFLNSET